MSDEQTYRIEYIYRVWDNKNGGCVTIEEGDDAGIIQISDTDDSVIITVEMIDGIVETLQHYKREFENLEAKYKSPDPAEVANCSPAMMKPRIVRRPCDAP